MVSRETVSVAVVPVSLIVTELLSSASIPTGSLLLQAMKVHIASAMNVIIAANERMEHVLYCEVSIAFASAAGDNLVLEVGISDFFVVPHDAVLHCQVFELAVVPDGHVRTDGTILDGNIFPNNARGN